MYLIYDNNKVNLLKTTMSYYYFFNKNNLNYQNLQIISQTILREVLKKFSKKVINSSSYRAISHMLQNFKEKLLAKPKNHYRFPSIFV